MANNWDRSWQLSIIERGALALPQDELAPLICPSCGGANLHHGAVEVAERKEEDQEGRIVTLGDGKPPQVEHADADSSRFAGRRNQLTVQFSCEGCEATPWLLLVQHKGTTFLGWCEPS